MIKKTCQYRVYLAENITLVRHFLFVWPRRRYEICQNRVVLLPRLGQNFKFEKVLCNVMVPLIKRSTYFCGYIKNAMKPWRSVESSYLKLVEARYRQGNKWCLQLFLCTLYFTALFTVFKEMFTPFKKNIFRVYIPETFDHIMSGPEKSVLSNGKHKRFNCTRSRCKNQAKMY